MRIVVNATSAALGGGITVLRQLLPAFAAVDGGRHEYLVVAREGVAASLDPSHPRVRLVASRFGGRSLATRLVWEQLALPIRTALGRADVLFSPSNLAVAGAPCPQVLMFQNLVPFSPEVIRRRRDLGKVRFPILRALGVGSARLVRALVFISRAQRDVILPQLGVPSERAALVYLGRDLAFSPAAREAAPALRARLGLPPRYLLSVSHVYHYKNFVELVRGFARARLPEDVVLAIAGSEHERTYAEDVRRAVREERLEGRVRLLGPVPYAELPALYAGSSQFLFPSTCESFPNILVEGLASGAPTLASNLGPMPELAGEGARYFDPFSPDEIGRRIRELFDDESAGRALSEAGVRQAARYSWNRTARELLGVLEGAAQTP